jgi:hypothetical protein
MAQGMERVISVVFQMTVLRQHSKYTPAINMHYTSLRSLNGILSLRLHTDSGRISWLCYVTRRR